MPDERSPVWGWLPGAETLNSGVDWLRTHMPQASPESQAWLKRRYPAPPPQQPVQLPSIPEPVKRLARGAVDYGKSLFEPSAQVKAGGEALKTQLATQTPETGVPAIDWTMAPQRALGSLAADSIVDASTPGGAVMNMDLPVGKAAALLGKAGATGLAALPPGFFSRVDRIAEAVGKKGVHPNKLKSLLQSGASAEEVGYRKVPELLAAAGDQPISKEALTAHLAANPAPGVETTVLGQAATPPLSQPEWQAARDQVPGMRPTATQDPEDLRIRYEGYRNNVNASAPPPKFRSYTLPGGKDYRETLVQHRPADPTAEEQFEFFGKTGDKLFHSGHFDQPNILAHVRHNERTLTPTVATALPENYAVHPDRNGKFYYQSPDGTGGVDDYDTVEEATRAAMAHAGQLEPKRGRFLEEVQSDWHQGGKKRGYQQPPTPEEDARRAALLEEIEDARRAVSDVNHEQREAGRVYQAAMNQQTRRHLPPEYADLTSFGDATHGGREQVEAWRTAREAAHNQSLTPGSGVASLQELRAAEQLSGTRLQEAVNRVTALQEESGQLYKKTSEGVPDAPFKESWPDLALKQQLLETARNPAQHWLGLASGKTNAERYDLSKQVSKIEYDPVSKQLRAYDHEGGQVIDQFTEPEDLGDYIGKEPADKLTEQINAHGRSRAYERDQWGVEPDPSNKGNFLIVDPNGEYAHDYGGGVLSFHREQNAHEHIDELIGEGRDPDQLPRLEGLDLQVGGEGMRNFYDQLLPKRLEKIVKPLGGGPVERGSIPVQKDVTVDASGFGVVDRDGYQRGWWRTRAEAEAYQRTPPPGMERLVGPDTGAYIQAQAGSATEKRSVDEPAWIFHMTPEVRARLLKDGLPLMALPVVAAAGALQSLARQQQGDNVGSPPPVRPPQ